MFRKSVFIMLFVCLLAPVAMAAYPWDNQLEWRSTAVDANWYNPANWSQEGTLPCPPASSGGPGPNFYCAVLPNQPGPKLGPVDAPNATCAQLSLNPWDPTSWGGQDVNVTILATAQDINCGSDIELNSWVDYDSYLGTASLVSRAILNVYGGTVRTPNPANATNLCGLHVGGGGDGFGLSYGMLNIYGGIVNVPRLEIQFGEVGLYGGTLQVNTDPNFVMSTSHPENLIKVDGGTFILTGNHTADINTLRVSNNIICERGTLRDPVYDAGPNTTTLIADINYCVWNPSPANGATNVHYKVNPSDASDPCSITLSWNESVAVGNIDANDDIYFGTAFADVNTATIANDPHGCYKGSRYDDNNDPCSFTIKDPNKFTTNTNYYWRADEYSTAAGFKKGIVWTFKTHDGKAYTPKPVNAGTSLSEPLQLSWAAGDWANLHYVFFGTNLGQIQNANTTKTTGVYRGTVSSPVYPLSRLAETTAPADVAWTLQAGVPYYWRVDEVNTITGASWSNSGSAWSFTPSAYINIDDFEDSMSTQDVNANWPDHYPITGCTDHTGNAGRLLVRDATGKYLSYTYNNNTGSTENPRESFSEAKRSYSGGTSFIGAGVFTPAPRALRIDYKGTATNAANNLDVYGNDLDQMYVALEDAAGNVSIYLNPDHYAQQGGNWYSWYTNLYDINNAAKNSNGVSTNLNAITGFAIGFGQRCNRFDLDGVDTNSVVFFDNIRLYASSCVAGKGPTADLDGDCDVDLNDLDVLAHAWLQHADNFVFSPCTVPHKAPILWFKFNGANQDSPVDVGTGDANVYTGTITAFIASNWKVGGGRDGNNCLYLPPGGGCYVDVNVKALSFIYDSDHLGASLPGFTGSSGGGLSFSIWSNADMTSGNMQTSWNGLFGIWTGTPQMEALELECPIPWVPTNNYSPACNFVKKTQSTTATVGTGLRANDEFGGRWNNWIFVKEPNSMKTYLNGNLIAHSDANGLTGDPNAAVYGPLCADPNVSAIRIGTRGGNWGMWNGYIQDFKVYDYNLTAGEVAYLATDGNGFTFLPLVSPANINQDGSVSPMTDANQIIDFRDIAIMGKQWHTQILWP